VLCKLIYLARKDLVNVAKEITVKLVFGIGLSLTLISCRSQFNLNEAKILNNESVNKIVKILDTARLGSYRDIKYIPRVALKTLTRIEKTQNKIEEVEFVIEDKFRIANPGEEYDATCAVTGKPTRQLIVILKNEQYFIMTYDHGGRGRHSHIMFFEIEGKKINDFWVGYGAGENIEEIKSFLVNNSGTQTNFLDF
jgi:hypothetical protein